MRRRTSAVFVGLLAAASLGCGCVSEPPIAARAGLADAVHADTVERRFRECDARVRRTLAEPAVEGAPTFDAARISFLGRARGEVVAFVRTPRATPDPELSPLELEARRRFERGRPGGRVVSLQERFKRQPESLRRLLLREGYAYFDDPLDGHWFARRVSLTDLFSEDRIFLQRGEEVLELVRRGGTRFPYYAREGASRPSEREVVLFGDRVATSREELGEPLHRDLAALARKQRLDRVEIEHHSEHAMVARVWRGERSVRALFDAAGAALELACVDEPEREQREFSEGFQARAAQADVDARIASAIDAFESERPAFDRPRGVEGPDRDGELRPYWMSAYLGGRQGYEVEDETYPVFLPDGRPNPPQVCVDFVLNVLERASGTWFTPRGERPARRVGTLDFGDLGIENRRGVLGFGEFARSHPELFEFHRFDDAERVPFERRDDFFRFLQDKARLRPGDIVAIQGLKPDGRVHQHAIYVERVDPLTGFPYALADKLGGSYRSTWEDIMGEAPKRSVLYRARPTAMMWSKLMR